MSRAYPALSVAKGHSLNASHIAAITRAALNNLGGMGRFVHKGDVVVVKPNIYGTRVPANACTTNPTVVATVVRECFKAGAKQVKVMDYPCGGDHVQSYAMSGIGPAAKAAGATVLQMSSSRFKSYSIPKGKAHPRTCPSTRHRERQRADRRADRQEPRRRADQHGVQEPDGLYQ